MAGETPMRVDLEGTLERREHGRGNPDEGPASDVAGVAAHDLAEVLEHPE